jgi:methylthioribose-1-phosphate isomerase
MRARSSTRSRLTASREHDASISSRRSAPPAQIEALIEQLRRASGSRIGNSAAVDRVRAAPRGAELTEALTVLAENLRIDQAIAEHAQTLLPARDSVLTHGGTGALSTGGSGTALGAIIAAHRSGKRPHAYVCETRPSLTGLRLSAYELVTAGVACTVIPDSAAATIMQRESPAAIIVGAHSLAANGDVSGEIGSYGLALAAAHHRIPFYVAVWRESIDFSMRHADQMRIVGPAVETRSISHAAADEMSFDVTPGHLVSAIITEYGITRPPYDESLPTLASRPRFAIIERAAR